MPIDTKEKIEAKQAYDSYAAQQQLSFKAPTAEISIDEENDRTNVVINIEHESRNYRLRSMKPMDSYAIFCYLNSQPVVRQKFADGNTVSWQNTKDRVRLFSDRFSKNNQDDLYLWSGFVVEDNEVDKFLGYANIGAGAVGGQAEIAYLNRPDAWNVSTPEILEEYELSDTVKLKESYKGIATAEATSLLQYAEFLKRKGRTIKHQKISEVVATARLDNPGSWKACAKNNMEIADIDVNQKHGPALRYQLRYKINL